MSRTGRAAKGFVTSIFQFSTQIVVQALLAPIVLKMTGRETLGAYSAVMQALGFIALTDFIGSWTLERFLGQASGLDDGGERFRCVFTTVRTIYLITVSAYSLLVVIFSFFVARLFHLSPGVTHQAQYALWVIAIWAVARIPFAAYMNASYAMQDMAAVNLIGTFTGIARSVASLVFVLLGGGLFALMLSGTIVESFGYVFYRMRFKKMNPHLMPGWGIPDKALFKEMLGFGGHTFVLNLGNGMVFGSGNIIAGMTHGAAEASTFYTTQMPTMTAYNMMTRLSDSAMPAINELWGKRDVEKLRNALRRLTRLLLALTLPLAVGVLLFNRDLVITWVGPKQYAGSLLTASLAGFCIIVSIQRVAIIYSFTFGWMRLLTVTALIQGIANFGLAFYLGKRLGLGGITLALLIVVLPQTTILWHRIGRFLEVSVVALFGGCISRAMIPLGSATACSLLVHRMVVIGHRHFFALLAEILAFAIVYAALAYPFVLVDHDRKEVKRYLRNVAGRGKGGPRRLARAFGSSSN
jgi:O-antigen/teichoic acid export membrane protein